MNVFSCIQRLRIASRDSKLSWLTLVASILILLCSFGFLQSFGILYNAFIEQYKSSKEVTGKLGCLFRFEKRNSELISTVDQRGLQPCTRKGQGLKVYQKVPPLLKTWNDIPID